MRLYGINEIWLENSIVLENTCALLNSGTVMIIETKINRDMIDIKK